MAEEIQLNHPKLSKSCWTTFNSQYEEGTRCYYQIGQDANINIKKYFKEEIWDGVPSTGKRS